MKIKYCTDDGKHEFATEKELIDFEQTVKKEKERREILIKEKNNRWEEVKQAYITYKELFDKYNKDYSIGIRSIWDWIEG